jgi:serine/threonine-protein kinase HipA
VFSVLIGNGDMHLKNWSLLYPDGRRPVLAPAYDYVSTIAHLPQDQLGLNFGGSKRIDAITRQQIERFADTARLAFTSVSDIVEGTVHQTLESWKKLEAKGVMGTTERQATEKHMQLVAASIK